MIYPTNTEEQFWLHVEKTDGCWNWTAEPDSDGYGRFSWQGKSNAKAHRVSFAIANGGHLPPTNVLICHTCDNRLCVRPEHLYAGSPTSNMRDRDNRGRRVSSNGEKNGASKLTDKQVEQIRTMIGTKTQRELSALFGVSQATVNRIKLGKTRNGV